MPNAQEVVASIQAFLKSQGGGLAKDLATQASSYTELCEGVNKRLKRCMNYLRLGLRSEAIYDSELFPDLLDATGALDLKQFDKWDSICKDNKLSRPTPLMLDVAAEINRAYSAEKKLRPLLKRLRMLSLCKAPLAARLDVLRSLAKKDPNNTIWQEDVEAFEKARLDEIAREILHARGREDMATLRELLQEVAGQQAWSVPVPPNMSTNIRAAHRHVQTTKALRELEALLPRLHEAHSALAYEEASPLLQQWNLVVSKNNVSVPRRMQEQFQPIADWIETEDHQRDVQKRFTEACFQLQRGLETETAVRTTELRRLHRQATSFEQTIDPTLQQDYERDITRRELERTRKVRLITGIVVTGLLVAGTGAAFLVYRGIVANRVNQVVSDIANAREERRFDDIRHLLQVLAADKPNIREHPLVRDEERKAKKDEEVELQRADQFRKALGGVESTLEQIKTEPASAGALAQLKELIEEAGKIQPGNDTEKDQLKDFIARTKDDVSKKEGSLTEAFLRKVNELGPKLTALGERLAPTQSAVDKCKEDLERLSDDFDELMSADGISSSMKRLLLTPMDAQFKLLEKRITFVEADIERTDIMRADVARLPRSAASAAKLAKALKDFATKHPVSALGQEFANAAAQVAAWTAVEHWATIVSGWEFSFTLSEDSEILSRTRVIDAYLIAYPRSPFAETIKVYLAYLAQAAKAENALKSGVGVMMTSPIMKLRYLKLKSGKGYYVPKDTTLGKGSIVYVPVVLTSRVTEVVQKTFNREDIESLEDSPQMKLSEDVRRALGQFSVKTWETSGLKIAEMIRGRTDVDPVLRMILLTRIMATLAECTWGMKDEISRVEGKLNAHDTADVNWMNPDDKNASRARERIKTTLAGLGDLETLGRSLRQKRKEKIEDPLLFNCVRFGVALREGNIWQVMTAQPLTAQMNGCKAAVVSDDKLSIIGEVKDAKVVVAQDKMNGVLQGTMVFIHK